MKILNAGCPRADGFYMPAEYAPQLSVSRFARIASVINAAVRSFTIPYLVRIDRFSLFICPFSSC